MTATGALLMIGVVFLLFGLLAGVAEWLDWRERVRVRKQVRLNLRRGRLL